jgi:hypothetical protein
MCSATDPSRMPAAIWSSRSAMVRQRSRMASAAGCTRGGARTNPAAAPMSVSMIRPVAAVFAAVTDRMSIALMGTSRMASPRRSA